MSDIRTRERSGRSSKATRTSAGREARLIFGIPSLGQAPRRRSLQA